MRTEIRPLLGGVGGRQARLALLLFLLCAWAGSIGPGCGGTSETITVGPCSPNNPTALLIERQDGAWDVYAEGLSEGSGVAVPIGPRYRAAGPPRP